MKRFSNMRKGFALLVAISVVSIITLGALAVQTTSLNEAWMVNQTRARIDARGALSAGVDFALREIENGRLPSTGDSGDVGHGSASFEITEIKRATAGEVGPALGAQAAEKPVVVVSLTGAARYVGSEGPAGASQAPSGKTRYKKAATAVLSDGPGSKILLWVNHPVSD